MNNVALFGYGTVGKGVKDIIDTLNDARVVKVFDLPSKKEELKELYCSDMKEILSDDSIDTLIECLGGDTLPYEVIRQGLMAGKNVISSNKQTIAAHLEEYLMLTNQYHSTLQFEASVGGGMPLLQPLLIQSQFDCIKSTQGILNGTCNYILTRMREKMSFVQALSLAQQKGLTEKDPTTDIEGVDMARKGTILASLTKGCIINPEEVIRFPLSSITSDIIDFFSRQGRKLKYVTEIIYGDTLSLMVLPIAVEKSHPLYSVDEEVNGCLIEGKFNEPLAIIGKGAGRYPTASAIIQDLERVIHHAVYPLPPLKAKSDIVPNLNGTFFVFDENGKEKEIINPSLAELKSYAFIAKKES